jgi:ABC-2 type transport system permease protein
VSRVAAIDVIAAERIKLLSTRSPWWSMLGTVALGVILTVAYVATNTDAAAPANVWKSQFGVLFALPIVMVMAALAVTTEYQFGTIRLTFQAVSDRTTALLAKTLLVAGLAAVTGEATAFACWIATRIARPHDDLTLRTGQHWRNLIGTGPYFAVAAVLAIAFALIVRHTAGVVATVVAYAIAGELVLSFVPHLDRWLPLNVGKQLLTGGVVDPGVDPGPGPGAPSSAVLTPAWSLVYYGAITLVLLIAGLVTANRRDA